MLMRDHSLAVDLAVANGRAPPHIEFLSVRTDSSFLGFGATVPDVVVDLPPLRDAPEN